MKSLGHQSQFLSEDAERLRWFLLPSEAQDWLSSETPPTTTPTTFTPKKYTRSSERNSEQEKEKTGEEKEEEEDEGEDGRRVQIVKFHHPSKSIFKPTMEVMRK